MSDLPLLNWNSPFRILMINLYINLACLSVCRFVCLLYSIDVKTAEPIGPKFFVGHHMTQGKVYGGSNFQKFASHQNSILENFENSGNFENSKNFITV